MKRLILTLFVFLLFQKAEFQENCPSSLICDTTETADTCPSGYFYRNNVKVNGCCPGCVGNLLTLNEPCKTDADCIPGLKCQEQIDNNLLCVYDEANQPCAYYKLKNSAAIFQPECLPDGTYAPRQCKGEKLTGRCFCYNKNGQRIFGEEYWTKADNMTCACSRLMDELQVSLPDISLHCNGMGNYEPLQCYNGVCWCADEYTGDPYTIVVPDKLMDQLPCYDANSVGTQYLRQCDSIRVTQEFARKLMMNHGMKTIYFPQIRCNFDGSYARYQILDNKKVCTSKINVKLNDGVPATRPDVDCNCLYDQDVFKQNGEPFDKICTDSGNYDKTQILGELYYCVDSDGYPTSAAQPNRCV